MAGTFQSLILTPPSTVTTPFPRRETRSLKIHPPRPRRSISTLIRSSKQSDEVDDSDSTNGLNWTKPLMNFAADNFLPLALTSGVAFGLANPTLGCLADKYYLSKFSTFGIFIVSGLTLCSDAIGAAAKVWPVGLFGLCSILLFTPYFSRLILLVPLQPQEFLTGLAIFNCMPTTLSSGVALTQLAGGNSALALAMTLVSNMLGILIIPFSISKFVADGVGVYVPTAQLLRSLVLTLLVPLILGKVLRESFSGLANFVDHNRKLFSKISTVFLSLVPWMQVSKSRSLLLMVKPTAFIVAIGMGMLLHLVLLAFNTLSIRSLSAISGGRKSIFAEKGNAQAVLLVASQKTLSVMVAVVEQLGGAFGESGLLVLPCVAAHLIQIILDSFLVNFWLQRDLSSNTSKNYHWPYSYFVFISLSSGIANRTYPIRLVRNKIEKKDEFNQKLSAAPNHSTLKYKLDMLKEFSKAKSLSNAATLKQEVNKKFNEVMSRPQINEKLEALKAEVRNSGSSNFADWLKDKILNMKKEIESELFG